MLSTNVKMFILFEIMSNFITVKSILEVFGTNIFIVKIKNMVMLPK